MDLNARLSLIGLGGFSYLDGAMSGVTEYDVLQAIVDRSGGGTKSVIYVDIRPLFINDKDSFAGLIGSLHKKGLIYAFGFKHSPCCVVTCEGLKLHGIAPGCKSPICRCEADYERKRDHVAMVRAIQKRKTRR